MHCSKITRVRAALINTITPSLADKDFRVRVTGWVEAGEGKVVVGGGRGVDSAEGFQKLDELAELLGAAVGCSRPSPA